MGSDSVTQGTLSIGADTWEWSVGSLDVGTTATLTAQATVDEGYAGTVISNTAVITGSNRLDPNPGNDRDTADLNVKQSNIVVTKSVSEFEPVAGNQIVFDINVYNEGPDDADDVVVSDVLPSQLVFVSADQGGVESGGTVTWDLGTVPAGENITVRVTTLVPEGLGHDLTLSNNATGTSPGDTDPTDNQDDVKITVQNEVTVGDLVFFDVDGDGVYEPEAGDYGIPGVDIIVVDQFGNEQVITTDENGNWNADTLPGNLVIYYDAESAPLLGLTQTAPASPSPGGFYAPNVAVGSTDLNDYDFGFTSSAGVIKLTKKANKSSASIGDMVLYTLEVENTTSISFTEESALFVNDSTPSGFKYVEDSARINGSPFAPPKPYRPLRFGPLILEPFETVKINYLMVVGTGVTEGEYINTAVAEDNGGPQSNTAKAKVCVVGDPIFDETTVIGKVFHDRNGNGIQDKGEKGIGGARVVSVRGDIITTDRYGRYHIKDVKPAREDRGGNFILKLDMKSLPGGAKMTTENPRVIRVTEGMMEKINFGVRLPEHRSMLNSLRNHLNLFANIFRASPADAAEMKYEPYLSITQDRLTPQAKLNLSMGDEMVAIMEDGVLRENIRFFIYSNYTDFIDHYRLSIYKQEDIEKKQALKVLELQDINIYKPVAWDGRTDGEEKLEKSGEYMAVLEAFGKEGGRDETLPMPFKVYGYNPVFEVQNETLPEDDEIPGFGMDGTSQRGIIPLGGKVVVRGEDVMPSDSVVVNGMIVKVDDRGGFIREMILPFGENKVSVEVKTVDGSLVASKSEMIKIEEDDMFFVALLDITAGENNVSGNIAPIEQDDHYDEDLFVDGRVAFYLKGKIKGKYLVTAQLDTGEDDIDEILDRLDEKDPRRVFKELDPEAYYPVYGDDSTLITDVNTQGRFYVKIEWDKSHFMWGNYNTRFTGTEFARYNRSLYGAQVMHESTKETAFGDTRTLATAFIAESSNLQDHNEFLSTGGTLYYLKNKEVSEGSEKVSLEVRDKDSGRVKAVTTLYPQVDYEIDNFQGRIILTTPLPFKAYSDTIISSQLNNGDDLVLVVDYEYYQNCGEVDDDTTWGTRAYHWLTDNIKLGGTYIEERRDDTDYELWGGDMTIKFFPGTYMRFEYAESDQIQVPGFWSTDGGLSFAGIRNAGDGSSGRAWKIEQFADFREFGDGTLAMDFQAWYSSKERGFSSIGEDAEEDTVEYGAEVDWEVGETGNVKLRHSTYDEDNVFYEETTTAQYSWKSHEGKAKTTLEMRHKKLTEYDNAYNLTVHPTSNDVEEEYEDLIAAIRFDYELDEWRQWYGILQATLDHEGDNSPQNSKATVGYTSQISERTWMNLELFAGDLGWGGGAGFTQDINERTSVYTRYLTDVDGDDGRTHTAAFGASYRFNDRTELYSERQWGKDRYEMSTSDIYGVRYNPSEKWTLDFSYGRSEVDEDRDYSSYTETDQIERDTASMGVIYRDDDWNWNSRVEFRSDRGDEKEEQWVTTNRFKYRYSDSLTWQGKFYYSITRDKTNNEDDARFVESSLGFAYRPVDNDRWNILGKYSYIEDLTPISQQDDEDDTYDEKSHVLSLEGIYQISRNWEAGVKAAWKKSEIRPYSNESQWYDSETWLLVGRLNWHVISKWDALLEYRWLDVDIAEDTREGWLAAIYRHIDDNFKVGLGYNFTDFNDDLTDLSYDVGGWFINVIGKW